MGIKQKPFQCSFKRYVFWVDITAREKRLLYLSLIDNLGTYVGNPGYFPSLTKEIGEDIMVLV